MHKEKKWEGQRLEASQIISYLLNLVQKSVNLPESAVIARKLFNSC